GRIAADLAAEYLVAALPAPGVEEARRRQRADAGGVHEGGSRLARAGRGDVLDHHAGKAPEVREREVVDVVELVRHADGPPPPRRRGTAARRPRLCRWPAASGFHRRG